MAGAYRLRPRSGFDFSRSRAIASSVSRSRAATVATVLYGDGAVGGVINIVTKTGGKAAAVGRIEVALAHLTSAKARLPLGGRAGRCRRRYFGNAIYSDGYRSTMRCASATPSPTCVTTAIRAAPISQSPETTSILDLPGARLVTLTTSLLDYRPPRRHHADRFRTTRAAITSPPACRESSAPASRSSSTAVSGARTRRRSQLAVRTFDYVRCPHAEQRGR